MACGLDFYLFLNIETGGVIKMATPVSQGGIDYPDGGFSGGAGGFPMIGDLAELAVRLESPHAYDRRGTVVWMTDFGHGLEGAVPGTSHAGCSYNISAERGHFGGYSLKMNPSDDKGSYVEWGNVVQFIESGPVGIEALVSVGADPDAVRVKILYFDGTTQSRAELNYDTASGDWTIRTGAATWVTVLSGFKMQADAMAWYSIKLVVDPSTGKYIRMQVAKESEDISSHDLYTLASANLGQLNGRVMVYGDAAKHAPIWVDGVIITQNE